MTWVRRELEALGIPPLKRFGQHFLVDKAVRAKLVDLAALTTRDTVLEVVQRVAMLGEDDQLLMRRGGGRRN